MGGKESKQGSKDQAKTQKDKGGPRNSRKSIWSQNNAKNSMKRNSKNGSQSTKSDKSSDYSIKRIIVYKNGDKYDPGTLVTVNRLYVKNWLTFLDLVTQRTKYVGAVHHIFTVEGMEVRVFGELEDQEEYVAAHTTRFLALDYGGHDPSDWNTNNHVKYDNPTPLASKESKQIYLYNKDYRPTLGDIWDDESFDMRKDGKPIDEETKKQNRNKLLEKSKDKNKKK